MESYSSSRDDADLLRLGKKPVLQRNLSFLTSLAYSCTVLVTWEASLIVFISGLYNGGPAGIVYGYIFVWAGMMSTFITLSEMASMAPTSGGQYHWVSILSPSFTQKFLGYITGWLQLTGWQAAVSSGAFLTGTMIQSLIQLTRPEYREHMQNWHGTLISWGLLILGFIINVSFSTLFARFESLGFIIHILGFFAVLIPLVVLGDHNSPSAVFDNFLNLGDWPTQGLSFSIGIAGTVFAFLGGDGAMHMAEEIRNPAIALPRSLLATLILNGTLGFGTVIALLFCAGDIDDALAEDGRYPFMPILRNALGSTAGAAVLASLIIVMSFTSLTGCIASTSRIYWAFARDQALPGWQTLKKTSTRTSIPFNSIVTTTALAAILLLINIGNATAFNGVISISIAGVMGSYLIAACVLLYRRLTGAIQEPKTDDGKINRMDSNLVWGPWRVKSIPGIIINLLTIAFLVFCLFFSFWPTSSMITPQNFNWAVLVTSVVLSFSVVYYFVWARKIYAGPIVEV
ncbi:putative GABA permease [Xylaria bambusicola]|uniref:putative GABA permease n=1 Tax=Xylaria bambusicola TaxID=326684 RepID=UPI00200728A0|nr:putative GABA permease [Xylaria bambusicola]KAI0505445.1 putative GABA permease [Xylaria bambusicola]